MRFRLTSRRLRERRCYPALRASRGSPADGSTYASSEACASLSRGDGLSIPSMLLRPGDFYGQGCGGGLDSAEDFAGPQFFVDLRKETVLEIADGAEKRRARLGAEGDSETVDAQSICAVGVDPNT